MRCPYCEVHIDKHEALDCLNLWVMRDVFGWTTSQKPYTGDFYPEGSYFVIWHQPEDFMPETLLLVSQAFDKDGNNLRSTEENPFGIWEEGPSNVVPFFYGTDIAAGMRLFMSVPGFDASEDNLSLEFVDGWIAEIRLTGKGVFGAMDPFNPSLAICRATLKAVENK